MLFTGGNDWFACKGQRLGNLGIKLIEDGLPVFFVGFGLVDEFQRLPGRVPGARHANFRQNRSSAEKAYPQAARRRRSSMRLMWKGFSMPCKWTSALSRSFATIFMMR